MAQDENPERKDSIMPQLRGPRPDPGPGGRAKPKPKVLSEPVPFTAADVTPPKSGSPPKSKLPPLKGELIPTRPVPKTTAREKLLRRTGETLTAAIAIERGKAEAHPRMEKPGAFGKLELSPRERMNVRRTFSESLEKSAGRRGVKRKPTGKESRSVAGLRKPVRKASRMSGSGR